ncbi:MAG: ATP-binding protein [Cyanobacteria bacterium P01_A01_bin.105]
MSPFSPSALERSVSTDLASELLADLLDAIAAPVYAKDAQHRWRYANQALCELLGVSRATLLRDGVGHCLPAAQVQQLRDQDESFLLTHDAAVVPITVSTPTGERALTARRRLMRDGEGAPLVVTTLQKAAPPTLNTGSSAEKLPPTARLALEEKQALKEKQALEEKLAKSTHELATLLATNETLKRITDRVRDSLDENQILQTAVKELTEALGAHGANTSLYDLNMGTSTIYYEHTTLSASDRGRVSQMEKFPEVYHLLLDGTYLQFCSITPNPVRGRVAMFACPIRDDQGVLGDLWLFRDKEHGFDELDIRLVQQVATQCAIAIRLARLYQKSQSQVRELERVNILKDDFLSTVSHELRTPVTSMRVALQLLGATLNQELDLKLDTDTLNGPQSAPPESQNRVTRYYRILKEECEREISLINDLLDLQRLDVGNLSVAPQPLSLLDWIPALTYGFYARTKSREQDLTVSVAPDIPVLITDTSSLERLLSELMNNACKYTPPGGSIQLTVQQAAEGTVRFAVTNTGIEISEKELPLIFGKFYRVPSADPWKQGGTGLGLALVQKLVRHIDGTITVTSGDQKTCFTVELPLSISAK